MPHSTRRYFASTTAERVEETFDMKIEIEIEIDNKLCYKIMNIPSANECASFVVVF